MLGLIVLSGTNSLAIFYGAFILIAIGTSCSSMTVLMTTAANWFRRRVGIATGIAVSGFGASGLLVPVMVRLIELYQWRTTMIIFAVVMIIIILPLSLLFRHKPEKYGYLPDGEVTSSTLSDIRLGEAKTTELGITLKQVFKNRTFWLISIAFIYLLMTTTSIATHVMPYLNSIGIDRVTAWHGSYYDSFDKRWGASRARLDGRQIQQETGIIERFHYDGFGTTLLRLYSYKWYLANSTICYSFRYRLWRMCGSATISDSGLFRQIELRHYFWLYCWSKYTGSNSWPVTSRLGI